MLATDSIVDLCVAHIGEKTPIICLENIRFRDWNMISVLLYCM